MYLRYRMSNGEDKIVELGTNSITIGRNPEVDVSIQDKMISRIHCGISFWDDAYFLRDFKSRNGTFLNGQKVDVARINPGDTITVGDTIFSVETMAPDDTATVIQEVKQKMDSGKGYHTILQEIIAEEKKK